MAKVDNDPEDTKATAPKWDNLDEMGLPIIDKAKDP